MCFLFVFPISSFFFLKIVDLNACRSFCRLAAAWLSVLFSFYFSALGRGRLCINQATREQTNNLAAPFSSFSFSFFYASTSEPSDWTEEDAAPPSCFRRKRVGKGGAKQQSKKCRSFLFFVFQFFFLSEILADEAKGGPAHPHDVPFRPSDAVT